MPPFPSRIPAIFRASLVQTSAALRPFRSAFGSLSKGDRYLNAMSRFHNYSFGNILEIARQNPNATRVAGLYAWNQLGRKVKKGEKGIRILAPIIGFRRKKDEEASRRSDPDEINKPMLVGFRSAYVFDVSQTDGAELLKMRELSGDVGQNFERILSFIKGQGIEVSWTESIAPALGISYGGRIAIHTGIAGRSGSRFSAHHVVFGAS
jgi:hypothetical protein